MNRQPAGLRLLTTRQVSHHKQTGLQTLVTGGAGFIGAHLVRLLIKRGHAVRVLDIRESPALAPEAEFTKGSILDRDAVRKAMKGVEHVYHLAAIPDLWTVNKPDFHAINVEGTRIVLEEAAKAGCTRIVHTSTESILKGHRKESDEPVDEQVWRTLADMPGPYCASKFLAEQEAMAAARYGLPVIVVNPTLPIGPGDFRITPPTQMIIDFVSGRNPGYLDFHMNLIDVRHAALGHILAAERGQIGQRYILGGENLRLSQILEILRHLTGLPITKSRIPYGVALSYAAISEWWADRVSGRPPKASLTGVRIAGAAMIFNNSKAVRELGLPQTSAQQALADSLEFLQTQRKIPCIKRGRESLIEQSTFT
jgi:dihydroflavonol-4-reductase